MVSAAGAAEPVGLELQTEGELRDALLVWSEGGGRVARVGRSNLTERRDVGDDVQRGI